MRLLVLLTTLATVFPSVWSHTYLVSPQPRNVAAYRRTPVVAVSDVQKYPYTINGAFQSFNTIGWCGAPTASRTPGRIPVQALVENFPPGTPAVLSKNVYTAGSTIEVYFQHNLPHRDDNIGTAQQPRFRYGMRVALNYSATDMVILNKVNDASRLTTAAGIVNGHIERGYDPQANAVGFVPKETFVLPQGKTCTNCVLQFWLESEEDGGGYVDCADIAISAPAQATTPPTQRPTGTLAPTNRPVTTNGPTIPDLVIYDPNDPSGNGNGNGGNGGNGGNPTDAPTDAPDGTPVDQVDPESPASSSSTGVADEPIVDPNVEPEPDQQPPIRSTTPTPRPRTPTQRPSLQQTSAASSLSSNVLLLVGSLIITWFRL